MNAQPPEPPETVAPVEAPTGPGAPARRPLWRRLLRWSLVALLALLALVAIVSVAGLTLDLGPALRARAEQEGSKQIQRPLHIGRLGVHLGSGRFVLEDVRIEGLTPDAEPFFTARRIDVALPWWRIARGEVALEAIELADWRMVVETFPDGRHNFIHIPRPQRRDGPSRVRTTLQLLRATRGEFVYLDHGTPWSTIARNLEFTILKRDVHRGHVRFDKGTIQIQSYEPLWANMRSALRIDQGKVYLENLELDTDGAVTRGSGVVDMGRWPEQTYEVESVVDFARSKDLFWHGQNFTLSGEGRFAGTFHLFKGGRELTGRFETPWLGWNAHRFDDLRGDLVWTPRRFAVTDAASGFYGGRLGIFFEMAPLGLAERRADLTLNVDYEGVDLGRYMEFLEIEGIRLAGRASGRNEMRWPMGDFSARTGGGTITAEPPPGEPVRTRELPADLDAYYEQWGLPAGPFNPVPLVEPVPVAGRLVYRFDPAGVEVTEGQVASRETFVDLEGRTTWGGRDARMPFRATSTDWQESDRVLAGVIRAFGGSARAVPVGGYGTFDGVMTGDFRAPRIEGRFDGAHLRAWNVDWGSATADLVIQNSYVDVTRGVMRRDDMRVDVEGRFALGYPRSDGGEEIDARVRLSRWSLADLRHAFELYDYPVDGRVSGDLHLYDRYERPHGFGRLVIEDGVAYDERFDRGTATLRFEGEGVRLDALEIHKGRGVVTGAAYVGWAGTYSFNAESRNMRLEDVQLVTYPQAPVNGVLQFTASGSGTFLNPRYEVRGRVEDLYIANEGVGQVTARMVVRDDQMIIEQLEAASPRLAVSGTGRVALTEESDGELTFRFSDTSLDPYLRAFQPGVSPYTSAVASGTVHVRGELSNPDHLRVDIVAEQVDLQLYDYAVRNDGPIRLAFDRQVLAVDRLRLVGEGTQIEVYGEVSVAEDRIALSALGEANLGILQGFIRDIRSSGQAEVQGEVRGTLAKPIVQGSATITDGRVRQFTLPHAIEALNGRIEFDSSGVSLDGLSGRLGGGAVHFGGRVDFTGLAPSRFALTARGTDMRIRYPEGFRSVVDADLALRGDVLRPIVSGTVTAKSAVWSGALDTSGTGIFGVAAIGGEGTPASAAPSGIPLAFDLRVTAPSTLRIETRAARLVSSADLVLRGTYDAPLLFGQVEIERGEVLFEGNRYQVTQGTVDFANTTRIEPFFDIEAETRARAPGQIYRVVFRVTGTPDRFRFDLTSDPPLSAVDILSLLFGDTRDPSDPELRALRTPNRSEEELIATQAARLLASPISANVGRVVEETFGVDQVQIAPSLGDLETLQSARVNPSARLTIGKRISERLYLTYARALSTSSRDQLLFVEFNQSDRLSWIVSQNEDSTYAVDVRVRHVF